MLPGGLDVVIDASQVHLLMLVDLSLIRSHLSETLYDTLERAAASRG
jgi:hypothetical protein